MTITLPKVAGALALATCLSAPCVAQTTSNRSRVTITHVKPDMANEWLDLQKSEAVPALKKAGGKTRTGYSSGLFGTAGEDLIQQPLENLADFARPGPLVKPRDWPGASGP